MRAALLVLTSLALATPATALPTPIVRPFGRPDALVDLRTTEGVRLVNGQWRYSDARIVEVEARGPGADLKPSGAPIKTYDYTPKAGAADFDDFAWEAIEPTALDRRRSTGKICFGWYRIALTVPERIGTFDPTGSTVAFEIVVDDYAGSTGSSRRVSARTATPWWRASTRRTA
jgi:gluconolactonase